MKIRGRIESGAGKGAFFTSLDWVVDSFERKMRIKLFPGTLNVRVFAQEVDRLALFLEKRDFVLTPVDPNFCEAWVKKVYVNGHRAAVVLPSEDVRIHGSDLIEVVADRSLKLSLGLDDGDEVTVSDDCDETR